MLFVNIHIMVGNVFLVNFAIGLVLSFNYFLLCHYHALLFNCYLLIYFVYMNPQKIAKKKKVRYEPDSLSYFVFWYELFWCSFFNIFFYVFCHVMWYYCYLSYFPQTCIKNNKNKNSQIKMILECTCEFRRRTFYELH